MNRSHPAPPPPNRRSFLQWATHGLGALFAVLLGAPAVAYFLDPRHRQAAEGKFKTVAKFDELTVGEPKQVVITDARRDAWTLHPNDLVGRVWLVKRDQQTVDAYTSICPHLGCSINFEARDKLFICPCHNGTFDLSGHRLERPGVPNPAPRDMDTLEQPTPDSPEFEEGVVKVKYENFYQGRHEKVAKK